MMRRFELQRNEDVTGVSGTGVVAEGVEFSTGWVALTWLTAVNSLVFYPAIANVEQIHGHNGSTEIVWLDEPEIPAHECQRCETCGDCHICCPL